LLPAILDLYHLLNTASKRNNVSAAYSVEVYSQLYYFYSIAKPKFRTLLSKGCFQYKQKRQASENATIAGKPIIGKPILPGLQL
jgi:hypothetical protein